MKNNYNVVSSTKKFDNTLFLEEDTNSTIWDFQTVEIRIAQNYIDIIAFSHDVDMKNPYYDDCEANIYITMSYSEAQAFVRLLGYELYHAESANISYEVPFETRSVSVGTCNREIWVNPEHNPFADDSSVQH